MEEKLRDILSNQLSKELPFLSGYKRAAVLLPLFNKNGRWHIFFTKRTDSVPTHKGQISFPGGAMDKKDTDLSFTALRETEEEMGINPGFIKIMGRLDDVDSVVSHYIVTPFVGVLSHGFSLKINNREIESVFEVPIRELMEPEIHYKKWRLHGNKNHLISYYQYNDKLIWGVTGNILTNFFDVLRENGSSFRGMFKA